MVSLPKGVLSLWLQGEMKVYHHKTNKKGIEWIGNVVPNGGFNENQENFNSFSWMCFLFFVHDITLWKIPLWIQVKRGYGHGGTVCVCMCVFMSKCDWKVDVTHRFSNSVGRK